MIYLIMMLKAENDLFYLSPQQLKLLKWPVEGSIGYGVSQICCGPIRPLWLLATKSHRRPVSRNADVTFIGARERTLRVVIELVQLAAQIQD